MSNLEEGTDANELCATGNVKFEIEYNGKLWKFERMKSLKFGTKQRIMSKLMNMDAKNGTISMDTEAYYMAIIPAMLLKAPPGFNVNQINNEFGQLLQAEFPSPGEFQQLDKPDRDEIKN